MPQYENLLGFQMVLSLNDVLSEILAVMRNFCPHIVDHERFCKVVLVVAERHSLEVKSHHCSAFDVTEFVVACGSVHICVKEFSERSTVFREIWVFSAFFPFLVVVHNVIGLWVENLIQFFVLKNLI